MIEWWVLAAVAVLFSTTYTTTTTADVADMTGCFSQSERIQSAVSDESAVQQSYLRVQQQGDQYRVDGLIWGANFHICKISSADEFTPGPLIMTRQGNRLHYRFDDPAYTIACRFDIALTASGGLRLHDPGNQCTDQVFYCGARIGLDGIELPASDGPCPTPDS